MDVNYLLVALRTQQTPARVNCSNLSVHEVDCRQAWRKVLSDGRLTCREVDGDANWQREAIQIQNLGFLNVSELSRDGKF